MQRHPLTLALGGVLVLAAVAAAPSWTATLSSTDGSTIAGSATVTPAHGDRSMSTTDTSMTSTRPMPASEYNASVSVTGAKAKSTLAWHVHEGHCPTPGAIVGSESGYQPLRIDERGSGQASATVAASLTEGKQYAVSVHGGESKSTPVIACGNLSSGTKAMP